MIAESALSSVTVWGAVAVLGASISGSFHSNLYATNDKLIERI